MMRSMYSAVSGLKTHQTKMDVIGNNIANVNTVAFKSSSVNFSEIMYQTLSNASGANLEKGTGGVNAKQIGLGTSMASTTVNVTSAGAAQSTGNPFDIRISDAGSSSSFFVVNNGSENLFTRAGSFYIDGAGNLAMTSTGYTVMGWQVDAITGEIKQDTVSALRIMQEKNLTSPPEATTEGTCAGVLDKNHPDVTSEAGCVMNLNFYDALGYTYTARFAVKAVDVDARTYTVELSAIYDSAEPPKNILTDYLAAGNDMSALFGNAGTEFQDYSTLNPEWSYVAETGGYHAFSNGSGTNYYINANATDGRVYVQTANGFEPTSDVAISDIYNGLQAGAQINSISNDAPPVISAASVTYTLQFDHDKGTFVSIGDNTDGYASLNMSALGGQFSNIRVDFSQCMNYDNGGVSTMGMDRGAKDGETGLGKKLGALTGLSIDQRGRIFGFYDNGNTTLLGQIAVARFANAAGLEKVGENCYATTLNSGEFDGIGVEITANGSKMSSGELEMSNVDLSSEFTEMITTQRGFQANSRVITTSDTLLEELINLKR